MMKTPRVETAAPVCLRITFELRGSVEEYLARCRRVAPSFLAVDGLVWKLWLVDAGNATAGGLYLFRDQASAESYLSSPVVEALRNSPLVTQVRAEVAPVALDLSAVTAAGVVDLALAVAR